MSVGERLERRPPALRNPTGAGWCDRCGNLLGRRARSVTIKAHVNHGGLSDGSQYMLCTGCSRALAGWLGEPREVAS